MASVLGSQMPNFLLCLHMVFSLLHALLVSLPLVRAPNLIGLKPNPYSLVVVIQLLSCVKTIETKFPRKVCHFAAASFICNNLTAIDYAMFISLYFRKQCMAQKRYVE